MKILTAPQIRALDAYTIEHEPISGIDLMERASRAFTQWFVSNYDPTRIVCIFCGKGNNGGDGLAIARLLSRRMYTVKVYIADYTAGGTPDFNTNLERLQAHLTPEILSEPQAFPVLPKEAILIDALLGSGLSRPVTGLLREIIVRLNASGLPIIAVDIASGLRSDSPNSADDAIVEPTRTVAFEVPKRAFMIPGNDRFVGNWQVVPIGLDAGFMALQPTDWHLTDREYIPHTLRQRGKFSHKGTYGHTLLIAGSYGKTGAAYLAGKACFRSGAGLLTFYTPRCGYAVLQGNLPEAMVLTAPGYAFISGLPSLEPYAAIGIGPGIGTDPLTAAALRQLLETYSGPLVLDADALNLLAAYPELLKLLPENSILTPHPKEFQRLAGKADHDYHNLVLAQEFAANYRVIICLKGAHTAVILPDKTIFFNNTGNPGMATGGSGDVLTGIITGLLAQGYPPKDAARVAVYKHGEAGDRAAGNYTQPALIASDLIEYLRW